MPESARLGLLEAFSNAWNAHDLAALMACMADDCVFEAAAGQGPGGTRYVGWADVRRGYATIFETFPDARWEDPRHFVVGDRGVSEWTFCGTRRDGTKSEMRGCDVFTFAGGRIAVKDSFRKAVCA